MGVFVEVFLKIKTIYSLMVFILLPVQVGSNLEFRIQEEKIILIFINYFYENIKKLISDNIVYILIKIL